MNSRPLNPHEAGNLACLNQAGKVSALLFLTGTGLGKGILDATEPMRRLLLDAGVHDYAAQPQGDEHKRMLEGQVHTDEGAVAIAVSLYRPRAKKGDPRIWFARFRAYVQPDDVCAVFIHAGKINVLNLTRSSLVLQIRNSPNAPLAKFFTALANAANFFAEELLGKLRRIAAGGPIEAVCEGSTAVGRSVEAALGIAINSSRDPDYHGIEIKSARVGGRSSDNRTTLFACVPDWRLSRCKSSTEILNEFGYQRGEDFKLYCTVSARIPNSQGLVFEFEDARRWLLENCKIEPEREVAVWRLETLENSLAAKHRETFWIKAKPQRRGNRELFQLIEVTHTRNPNIPQLERMLRDGMVTMDHLIKRKPSGAGAEKGPLFKIQRDQIPELFLGEPKQYAFR